MSAHTFTVPDSARKERLDKFLGENLRDSGISREKIKLAIAAGLAAVNGETCLSPKTSLRPGDTVSIEAAPPPDTLSPEQGEITLLHRDRHLAVLNKPAGLTVHPAPGLAEGTLAHRLIGHFPELAEQGGLRPGIVHRLDKDTSGLMLVALNEKTRLALSRAFAARTVHKVYLALVRGVPKPAAGDISAPIGRHPTLKTKMAILPLEKGGREAKSAYRTLYADPGGRFALLAVAIHTGRTHQIRVHMAHTGHPLLGDAVYGGADARGTAPRQMLHAWKLRFTHPESGKEMTFTCPPPEDFVAVARALAAPPQRVVVTGSAGCGKSSLMAIFREANLPVWSADASVRALYGPGGDGAYLLRKRYGSRFVPEEGAAVDKAALFAAMRESDALRREVENLIRPLARHDLENFRRAHEQGPQIASAARATLNAGGAPLTVAEIPVYLESGWRGQSDWRQNGDHAAKRPAPEGIKDLLVGIYCPFALRKERMMRGRGWDEATIATMEAWHWPEDKKICAADLVLDNSGSLEDLRRRAKSLIRLLERLREHAAAKTERMLRALWEEKHG